jgi:UDP-N-acetylglucosamine 2-epimerase (non-hydrolysing)
MAPVVIALQNDSRFASEVLVTAQHRDMLDQVLSFFNIHPDYDLNIMIQGQTLEQITSRALEGVSALLSRNRPDVILVHGDTTTTFAAALAGFYHGIPVGHIEAGMRTGDMMQPFPEELNRSLVARLARYHFAPSAECVQHLYDEGVESDRVIRTVHNTGVDALILAKSIIEKKGLSTRPENHILVTAHRRESWGAQMQGIFRAVRMISSLNPDYQISVATHANPAVADDARAILKGCANVALLSHQSYEDFVRLMAKSRVILSDSGGIQEEGPTLGVPVVVLRNKTEYHELLEAGVVFLAGTKEDDIVSRALDILGDATVSAHVKSFAEGRAQQSSVPLILDTLASRLSTVASARG